MRGWTGVALVWTLLAGCGSTDGGREGVGGAGGDAGSGTAGVSAGGSGSEAGAAASGGAASGGAASGGAASGGAASGGAASGGASGAGDVLFSDEFDTERAEWQFDQGDPEASYVYDNGDLLVTGGSAQAFVWLPVKPEWGSDYQVDVRFQIESGMVGGAVVRAQDTALVNAYNCNLREDLDQLRAARHTSRNYLTIGSRDTPVDLQTSYAISGRVTGDTLHCSQQGGPSFDVTNIPGDARAVGLFVYRGTVRFESFTLRR